MNVTERAAQIWPVVNLSVEWVTLSDKRYELARQSVYDCGADGGRGRRLHGVVSGMVEAGLASPARSARGRS